MAKSRFQLALAATTVATGLALSACGSSGDVPTSATASAGGSAQTVGRHNAADVSFAQAMIVHDRQGVQVAGMAPARAVSAQVKDLASTILAADQSQLGTLTSWLQAWGAAVPAADMTADDLGDQSGTDGSQATAASGQTFTVAGLMDSEAVIELGNGHGRVWDGQFLRDMSSFQGGAVQMAEVELSDGVDPHARALAQEVVDADGAQVLQVRRLIGH